MKRLYEIVLYTGVVLTGGAFGGFFGREYIEQELQELHKQPPFQSSPDYEKMSPGEKIKMKRDYIITGIYLGLLAGLSATVVMAWGESLGNSSLQEGLREDAIRNKQWPYFDPSE